MISTAYEPLLDHQGATAFGWNPCGCWASSPSSPSPSCSWRWRWSSMYLWLSGMGSHTLWIRRVELGMSSPFVSELSSAPPLASLENFGLILRIVGLHRWDAITLYTQNSQNLARTLRTLVRTQTRTEYCFCLAELDRIHP